MKPMTNVFRQLNQLIAGFFLLGLLGSLMSPQVAWPLGESLTVLAAAGYFLAGWVTMRTARLPAFQWLGFGVHFVIVATATYLALDAMRPEVGHWFTKIQELAIAAVIGGVYSLLWFLAAREQGSGN